MNNFVPCGFDEDGHAPINSPLDPPRLVAVLDEQWCETCWTDTHDECGSAAGVGERGGREIAMEKRIITWSKTSDPERGQYSRAFIFGNYSDSFADFKKTESRPLRRDSLCPAGATLVSTMPTPSGDSGGATR